MEIVLAFEPQTEQKRQNTEAYEDHHRHGVVVARVLRELLFVALGRKLGDLGFGLFEVEILADTGLVALCGQALDLGASLLGIEVGGQTAAVLRQKVCCGVGSGRDILLASTVAASTAGAWAICCCNASIWSA